MTSPPARPPEDPASPPRRRGWRYVLLAQPTVQTVRFLAKLAFAQFLLPEQLGVPMLAALVAFVASLVALYGLDDAVISAPRLGGVLWRRLQRFHHATGAALALACALVGLGLGAVSDEPLLGELVLAFAPMVWLANQSVLPTALMVRERQFQKVFLVDVFAVVAYAATTVALAMAGAGPWSLVGGLYANAVVTVAASRAFARPLVPRDDTGGSDGEAVLRYGRQITGATVLGFLSERADSFAVGLFLGAAVLGVYEYALLIAQAAGQYFQSIAERGLFPVMAARHRQQTLPPAYEDSLRLSFTFALPLHVVLAFVAVPLVTLAFPAVWHGAGPLLALLALAAGARCVDLVPSSALKAAGHSGDVLALSLVKLAMLAVALPVTLPRGALAVAGGMVAVRVVGAMLSWACAARHPELRRDGRAVLPSSAVGAMFAWSLVFVPAAWWLHTRLGSSSMTLLLALPPLALLLWALSRAAIDRAGLARDWSFVHARMSGGGPP